MPIFALANAVVAQLVEHQLPKLRVAGSSPVCRSCEAYRHIQVSLDFLTTTSIAYLIHHAAQSSLASQGAR